MAKVKLELDAQNKASGAIQGLVGDMVKAQLSVEALKAAFSFLVDQGKKSIEAFKESSVAEAQLTVATQTNIDAFKKFASNIQELTTIEDDAIIKIDALMSSMGVSNEKLNDAAKGAIGLSKALDMDLNSAARMTAKIMEGNYDALAKVVPSIRNATTDAEKMAIAQRLMNSGFEMAQKEAQSFTGKLDQLKNLQGDTYESLGLIVSVLGKDFVDGTIKAQKAINDFLSDTDLISNAGAGFKVFQTMVTDLASEGFDVLKDAGKELLISVKDLVGTSGVGNIDPWLVLSGAVKIIGIGFSVLVEFAKLIIQYNLDLIKTYIEVGKLAADFFTALINPTKWGEFRDQAGKTGDAIKKIGTNIVDNAKDIVSGAVENFKKLPDNIKQSAEKYEKTFKNAHDNIKKDLEKTSEEISKKPLVNPKQTNEQLKETENYIKAFASTAQQLFSGIASAITSIMDDYYQTQIEATENWKESALENVQAWADNEMEIRGVKEESDQERLGKEINALQDQKNKTNNINKKAAIQDQITEKQKELERLKIKDEAAKREDQINKEAKDKETALKKKQFEENKALQIAMIWINAAAAVIATWAGYASMNIAGAVLAGIQTGLILTLAGVQTGVVASTQFHAQEGGVIPGTSFTGDRVVLGANSGEAVFKDSTYKNIVAAFDSGSFGTGITITGPVTIVANNPQELIYQLNEVARYERGRR